MTASIRKHQHCFYFHSNKSGCSWPWVSPELQDGQHLATPGDLCYICLLERAEIYSSPSEQIQFPTCPITILSFFVLLQRHFLQVLNRTEQKSHLIHWTFRNAWKPVSTANEIKTVELWQIENLLKTVQQSMQPVSILVFKKKINFKRNFCKGFVRKMFFLGIIYS